MGRWGYTERNGPKRILEWIKEVGDKSSIVNARKERFAQQNPRKDKRIEEIQENPATCRRVRSWPAWTSERFVPPRRFARPLLLGLLSPYSCLPCLLLVK